MSIESDTANQVINSLSIKKAKPFESRFPDCEPDAISFLKQTLVFNPTKRMTVE